MVPNSLWQLARAGLGPGQASRREARRDAEPQLPLDLQVVPVQLASAERVSPLREWVPKLPGRKQPLPV